MIAKITGKNRIEVFDLTQFDTDAILHSGQVFRYSRGTETSVYSLVVGQNKARLYNEGGKVVIETDNPEFFWNYFDLDTNYTEIKEQLKKFATLNRILGENSGVGGIRILRGEFVETVISFIISANNNIKRFTKTLNLLSGQFGTDNCFPTLEQLSTLTAEDFKRLGCGYRSGYLVKAVAQIAEMNFNDLCKLSVEQLKKTLTQIAGVGPKVASCIILFSDILPNEERFRICPVDVHIGRALEQLGKEQADVMLNHKYAGVIQQYIFYYVQSLRKKL